MDEGAKTAKTHTQRDLTATPTSVSLFYPPQPSDRSENSLSFVLADIIFSSPVSFRQ